MGFTACGWESEGLVCGFENEGVVLNEGAGDYSFRPVDSELDNRKRDPLVAFLDDAGLTENDFVRNDVMREAVSFTCHELCLAKILSACDFNSIRCCHPQAECDSTTT